MGCTSSVACEHPRSSRRNRTVQPQPPPHTTKQVPPCKKSHECSTPSVVPAVTGAKGVGNKPHKWISETMWRARSSVGATPTAATKTKRNSPGLNLDLVHSNHNFDSSTDYALTAPPSTDRRSAPSTGSTKAFWKSTPAASLTPSTDLASPLPKCAQQYQDLKSLERVKLKAKCDTTHAASRAPRVFTWSDCGSGSGSHGDTTHMYHQSSTSSCLSGELPFMQGLLFSESLREAVNNGDLLGMATPQGSPR